MTDTRPRPRHDGARQDGLPWRAPSPSGQGAGELTPPAIRRPLVIGAVMASMVMVAIEATIVATAMPQIVGELGGLPLYGWMFASFLLSQTVATLVSGKLADGFGRRRVMLWGIGIFLAGSLLCGLAASMPAMIAFRLVQGVGAGAVQPVGLTVVADLYPGPERGKVQGWLASVWAVSAVIGPALGALIVRDLSWPWIFWINLPVGCLAAAGFAVFLREEAGARPVEVDLAGAVLFTVATGALMTALTRAGAGDGRNALAALAAGLAGAVLLVRQERRALDPIVSPALWRRQTILVASGINLLAGMALMGLTSFLPLYVQGVMGREPVTAGLSLTVMLVGWPAGATLAARVYPRVGLARVLACGCALMPAGAVAFVLLRPSSPVLLAAAGSTVVGFGMGMTSIATLVMTQDSVPRSMRGSATAALLFARNLGSALGATLLGAILTLGLRGGGEADLASLQRRLEAGPSARAAIGTGLATSLRASLDLTFKAVLGLALVSLAVGLLALRRGGHAQPAGQGAAERQQDPAGP